MNIFVCVKQVPDTETKVMPNSDQSYIDKSGIKWVMNPYDEFAVEQAILIKEKNPGSKVFAVRVGEKNSTEILRTAMAMGCDESILVETNEYLDSFLTAKCISEAIKKSGVQPDIVLAGKQAVDDDCLQVPQILAEMLAISHVSVIVEFKMEGQTVEVKREIDGGSLEVYKLSTPVLLSCNKGINKPRYPSLPGIIKAKKKPLTTHTLADLAINLDDLKVKYSNFRLPPAKPPGKKFEASEDETIPTVVKEVLNCLKNEAKVL